MTTKAQILEGYLLAKDKEEYLESIKTSSEYRDLLIHHSLNHGKELPEKYRKLVERQSPQQKFYLKKLVQRLDTETGEEERVKLMEEINSTIYGYSLSHTRAQVSRAKKADELEAAENRPHSLQKEDLEFFDKQKVIEQVYSYESETAHSEPGAFLKIVPDLRELDIAKIKDVELQIEVLEQIRRTLYHVENIGELLKSIQEAWNEKNKKDGRTWSIPESIWQKLTLSQAKEVAEACGLENSSELTRYKFSALLHEGDGFKKVKKEEDEAKVEAYFRELLQKVQEAGSYKQAQRIIKKCLLVNSLRQNKVDIEAFKQFLENPISDWRGVESTFSTEKRKEIRESETQKVFSPVDNYYLSQFDFYLLDYPDRDLVEKVLDNVVVSEEAINQLQTHFNRKNLKGKYLTQQLLAGGSIEAYAEHFGQHSTDALVNKKELEIVSGADKRVQINHKTPIEISLKIKNIEKLEVRQYTLDTMSYLKEHGSFPDHNIDLNGLVPKTTKIVEYEHPKQQEHVEEFKFEELDALPTGVFIIDFVGGGLTSRAVVRKGMLTLLKRDFEYGHNFFILDSDKQICRGEGTGIFVDGKLLKVNQETGAVQIPFDSIGYHKSAILIHNGFGYPSGISVDRDEYQLKSQIIFNEEALLPGRKAKIILWNKLTLNNKQISIKKLSDVVVTLHLRTLDGISNTKIYDNVELSDLEDYVVEFVVPNKLNSVSLVLNARVETVSKGFVPVSTRGQLEVTRHEGTVQVCSLFVKETPEDGYSVLARGKNGEPLVGKGLSVALTRDWDRAIRRVNLWTDKEGAVRLGKLEAVAAFSVNPLEGDAESLRVKVKNHDEETHISDNYALCQGEDLVLPGFGLELNRVNFDVYSYSGYDHNGPLLNVDHFDKLSLEEGSLVLSGLTAGNYSLRIGKKIVGVAVHEGERWGPNPSMIEAPGLLKEIKSEQKLLDFSSITINDDSVDLQITSNDLEHVTVHVLGYKHAPTYADYIHLNLTNANHNLEGRTEEIFFEDRADRLYISGKELGDEMMYVMQRKNKKNFIGNTLKKPSILLHRKFVKETKEDLEVLRDETGYDDRNMRRMMEKGYGGAHRMMYGAGMVRRLSAPFEYDHQTDFKSGDYKLLNDFEYLKKSGKTLPNLKADENGLVKINRGALKGYSKLVLFVSDGYSNGITKLALPVDGEAKNNDLRLKEAKEAGVIYTEERSCEVGIKNQNLVIKEANAIQRFGIESIKDLSEALLVITQANKSTLNEWKFLLKWSSLKKEEKFKKLDKYGGHELNVFCYLKDRQFFDENIKPLLKFKSEKQLIDYILTQDVVRMERAFNSERALKLKPLELVLLLDYFKDSKKELCEQVLVSLQERNRIKKRDETQWNTLFDSILASKKIEAPEIPSDGDEDYEEEEEEADVSMGGLFEGSDSDEMYAPKMAFGAPPPPPGAPQPESFARDQALYMMSASHSLRKRAAAPRPPMIQHSMKLGGRRIQVEEKKIKIEKYKKAGAAFEYGERQQHFSSVPTSFNDFWLAVTESIVKNKNNQILGASFIECRHTDFMYVYALAFYDLPFTPGAVATKTEDYNLELTSTENYLVLCKRMQEKKTDSIEMDLIVSQKFYDPTEKYRFDENDPSIKSIKQVEEFLAGRVYASQVTLTNISQNHYSLKLITQVPGGAIPVSKLDYLKIYDIDLSSYRTRVIDYLFYFPVPGEFNYYPATVTSDNKLVGHAELVPSGNLKVVNEFSKPDKELTSLQDILNYGTQEDVLRFMEEKNLYQSNIFDINKVLWLFAEKEHYPRALNTLRDKCFFDSRAWAYSIKHKDFEAFEELLENDDRLQARLSGLRYLKSNYVSIDTFKPLEYDPLINPRAHSLSSTKQNILNKSFKQTYEDFLLYCVERPELTQREWIILVSYLVLQERIEEALQLRDRLDEETILRERTMVVQYEYLKAYLSIFEEYPEFKTARTICEKYLDFSDLSWRSRFKDIKSQMEEFDGEVTAVGEEANEEDEELDIKHASNKELAEKVEYLKLEEKKDADYFVATYMNLEKVTVSFFKLNMEILFSKDPFLNKNIEKFTYVNPNSRKVVDLAPSSDFASVKIEIPESLSSSSLFVHVLGKSKSETLKIFNTNFLVHPIEDFGLLKVSDKEGKLLSSIYVKCYSRGKDGNVKFYKDGYTDFRGSFDYASLNSDSLDKVEVFSILVIDSKYGSTIVEAKPPRKVGQIKAF